VDKEKKDRLVKQLMATFLEELDEHVRALNKDLLALEKNPPPGEEAGRLLKGLFRTAHSLKGASRSVNVALLECVCHQLEDILGAAQEGRLFLGPEQFGLLYKTADGIEEAGKRLREQQDLSDAPLAALLPRLEAAVRGLPSAAPTAAARKDEDPGPRKSRNREPKTESRDPPGQDHGGGVRASADRPAAADPGPPAPELPPVPPAETVAEPATGPATVRVSAEKLEVAAGRVGPLAPQGPGGVRGGPRPRQGGAGNVGGEDVAAAAQPFLGQQDRQRICLLPGGAAGAPGAGHVVGAAAAQQVGQDFPPDEGELRRLAEEVRFTDRQLDDEVVEGGVILAEESQVLLRLPHLRPCHRAADAGLGTLPAGGPEAQPGALAEQPHHALEGGLGPGHGRPS
jgi:HPt (histidine-containing phosphotransfer) domain-containing protein